MAGLYSPVETVPNFRDVGRFINEKLGSKYVHLATVAPESLTQHRFMKTGLFYRGARPGIYEPLQNSKGGN